MPAIAKKLAFTCLLTIVAAATCAAGVSTASLLLVPMPREIEDAGAPATIAKDWAIRVATTDKADGHSAGLLQEETKFVLGEPLAIKTGESAASREIVLSAVAADPKQPKLFNEQGYRLTVQPERITIEASTSTGRFYGVQTLRQLLRTSQGGQVPGLKVRDYPALEIRGVSDDISRGQVSTLEDFKETVRRLAFYKKNMYQPYIEDMFRFDTDPQIGADRGAVTKAEMAEILKEAELNHITLTPVFETLGHQDRLLSLPENRKYAEIQDNSQPLWSFAPTNPEAVKFILKLVAEMAAATPSPYFHIGGDESWDVGQGVSKARVKKVGIGRVHADFFTEIHDYVAKALKRRTMLYSDMLLHHPDSLKSMPKDMIIVDWHYQVTDDYPSVKKLKDAGYGSVLTSPGLWSWDSFYPNYRLGFGNAAKFTDVARREEVLGSIMSSWGDNGAENLRENNLVGFAYSAAVEWETSSDDPGNFLNRYVAVRYGIPAGSAELASVEKELGWSVPQGFNSYGQLFHRTLRLKPFIQDQLTTMAKLEKTMTEVRDKIKASRGVVKLDAAHLDSLDHAARRLQYMARRQQTLDQVARQLGDKPSGALTAADQSQIMTSLSALRDELASIAAEYPSLWLRRNKYPKLDFNIDRLYKQVGQIQNMIDLCQAGLLRAEQPPDGTWMWYPEADPKTKTTTATTYFVKTVDLPSDVVSAEMKLFADDGCRIWINGKRAARATYGSGAIAKNVADLFKKGKNFVAIEANNGYGAAGILLTIDIVTPDGKVRVTADESWKTSQKEHLNWKTTNPTHKDWVDVKLLGKGLVAPWTEIDW
ncbi:MAG: family 20 glycosylhydrolase [Candidatus Sumerlaeaceae bacterium]|nr:family 20 glycosylhydrolase [Candidatus Sumerlaeaceae bacterium]